MPRGRAAASAGGGYLMKLVGDLIRVARERVREGPIGRVAREIRWGRGANDAAGRVAGAARRGENPLDHIPRRAQRRSMRPVPGGAQDGVEYKWRGENGTTTRVRVHGPDPSAPPGTNAHSGPIYRVQVGGRYMDPNGTLYPRNVHNPNSPHYDPNAANATHIPWPPGLPYPRR